MKSLKEYIKESLASSIDVLHLEIVGSEAQKQFENLWRNAAAVSKEAYNWNKTFSLHQEKEKQNFLNWLNGNVYDTKWKIKLASPGTYQLFYLPAEIPQPNKSEKAKELLNQLYSDCEKCSSCICTPCESIDETLNDKDAKKLIKDIYKHSNIFKDKFTESKFNDFIWSIVRKLDDAQADLEDESISFNKRYSMLGNSLSDAMVYNDIDDNSEEFPDMFDELMEFFTAFYGIE